MPALPLPPTDTCTLLPFTPNCVAKGVNHAASAAARSVVDEVARSFATSAINVMQNMMTLWTKIPAADVNNDDPGDKAHLGSTVYFIQWHLGWVLTWVAVLGLLLAAGKMAWQRRGEPFREAMSGLVTMLVTIFVAAQAVNLAVQAGDAYSDWILRNAAAGPPTQAIGDKAATLFIAGGLVNSPGVILIVALLAILASVAQMAMMIVRGAMLVLLVGVLPVMGAASITAGGKGPSRKMIGWLIAYVLYKPVAATIYADAFFSLRHGDPMSQLQGMILIALAVVALPALMRFVAPVVSAAGGSGGGGALAAAGGAAALGARMVPSLRGGGRGGGSGGGGASPTGPSGAQAAGPGQQPGQDSPPSSGAAHGNPGKMPVPAGVGAQTAGTAAAGTSSTAAMAGTGVGAPVAAMKQGYDMGKNAAKGAADSATSGDGGPSGS
jgi:type IV secretion system protein TrbL